MKVVAGQIAVEPAAPRAAITAVISAASFSTGNRARDRHIRSAKFLDAGPYPHITFRAGTLSHDGDHWTLAGELTIRQVTSSVRLAISSVEPAGSGFRARAATRIDRYAFGLTAAKGMAARHLDIAVTAVADPR
jgi:polyisoprenoid-binding protein YceI